MDQAMGWPPLELADPKVSTSRSSMVKPPTEVTASGQLGGVRFGPLAEGAGRAAGQLGDGGQHRRLVQGALDVEAEERVDVLDRHAGRQLRSRDRKSVV